MQFVGTTGAGGNGIDNTRTPVANSGNSAVGAALNWMLSRNRPGATGGGSPNSKFVSGGAPMPLQTPRYTPQLASADQGTAPQKYETRTVLDPYRNPYENYANPGAAKHYVTERFINGQWEFDNVDQSRKGSGGAGSINPGNSAAADFTQLNALRAAEEAKTRLKVNNG